MDYLSGSVEIRNDCPSREVEESTMTINISDVIWRQAFDLYAIQDIVSCPWSSISLVWSHAAGLPVDYMIGLVEIRNDCRSREVEEATMAINVCDMEAAFCFVCHSRPCVMPMG